MSKKTTSIICVCTILLCFGICLIGSFVSHFILPWWLIAFAGGIICAIVSMVGDITREQKKSKKSKRIIGCICSSICMISVLAFLTVNTLTQMKNSWVIICIGGIASMITYFIYSAVKDKKNK